MTSYTGPDPQVPSVTPVTEPGRPARRGLRISPKAILLLVILAIVLWFAFANTRDAQIKLWVKDVQAPVWLVLLCTFAAGIISGWLLRRRRRTAN